MRHIYKGVCVCAAAVNLDTSGFRSVACGQKAIFATCYIGVFVIFIVAAIAEFSIVGIGLRGEVLGGLSYTFPKSAASLALERCRQRFAPIPRASHLPALVPASCEPQFWVALAGQKLSNEGCHGMAWAGWCLLGLVLHANFF